MCLEAQPTRSFYFQNSLYVQKLKLTEDKVGEELKWPELSNSFIYEAEKSTQYL